MSPGVLVTKCGLVQVGKTLAGAGKMAAHKGLGQRDIPCDDGLGDLLVVTEEFQTGIPADVVPDADGQRAAAPAVPVRAAQACSCGEPKPG